MIIGLVESDAESNATCKDWTGLSVLNISEIDCFIWPQNENTSLSGLDPSFSASTLWYVLPGELNISFDMKSEPNSDDGNE